MNCQLCERKKITTHWFYITECKTCHVPLIVSTEHKDEFMEVEKHGIRELFGDKYDIRWDMREIKNHAHCHLEAKSK